MEKNQTTSVQHVFSAGPLAVAAGIFRSPVAGDCEVRGCTRMYADVAVSTRMMYSDEYAEWALAWGRPLAARTNVLGLEVLAY